MGHCPWISKAESCFSSCCRTFCLGLKGICSNSDLLIVDVPEERRSPEDGYRCRSFSIPCGVISPANTVKHLQWDNAATLLIGCRENSSGASHPANLHIPTMALLCSGVMCQPGLIAPPSLTRFTIPCRVLLSPNASRTISLKHSTRVPSKPIVLGLVVVEHSWCVILFDVFLHVECRGGAPRELAFN